MKDRKSCEQRPTAVNGLQSLRKQGSYVFEKSNKNFEPM
jgi:hypothetical protein